MKFNLSFMKKYILLVLIFVFLPIPVYSSAVDNSNWELVLLDRTKNAKRRSYLKISNDMYQFYKANPRGKDAERALHVSAKSLKSSFNRFKVRSDIDKSLEYYRLLQNQYTLSIARGSYLESADIYILLRDPSSAKFILNRLISRHPNSIQADRAMKKLSSIGGAVTSNRSKKPSTPTYRPKQKSENRKTVEFKQDTTKQFNSNGSTRTGTVTVKGIRYFSARDYTRIVIDISEQANYSSIWLNEDPSARKPPRLTIDIPSSKLMQGMVRDIPIKDGLLSAVRIGYHPEDKRTRIVLDSENVKDFTIFQMPNPNRLVIDVFSTKQSERPRNLPAIAKNVPVTDELIRNIEKTFPKRNRNDFDNSNMTLGSALGLKIRTLVIDPGHGGKDPGAIYGKLREKDIVLDISRRVRNLLLQDKSLKVYMTRNKDIFLPLEERTALANKYKADLFISIHANAAKNKRISGVEIFVFNVTNDRAALEVAAFENQATTRSISDLQDILIDILKYSKLEESLLLASSVQKSIAKKVQLSKSQNKGVKQAPFYVLVGATMPAILIETGFLSNSVDSKKLATKAYRIKIAEGIHKGLRDYIIKYNQ